MDWHGKDADRAIIFATLLIAMLLATEPQQWWWWPLQVLLTVRTTHALLALWGK